MYTDTVYRIENLDLRRLYEMMEYEPKQDLKTLLNYLEPNGKGFIILKTYKNIKKNYWNVIVNTVMDNKFLYKPVKRFLLEISSNSENAFLETVVERGLNNVHPKEVSENSSEDTIKELVYLADLLLEVAKAFSDLYENIRDTTMKESLNLVRMYNNEVDLKTDIEYRMEGLYLDVVKTFVNEADYFFDYSSIFYDDNVNYLKETIVKEYLSRIPYFSRF